MLLAIVGVIYGSLIGFLEHWLTFHVIDENQKAGREPLKGIGPIFFLRYILDAIMLVAFALVTRDGIAIAAAAVSITVAIKVSLIIVYTRKGGRIE